MVCAFFLPALASLCPQFVRHSKVSLCCLHALLGGQKSMTFFLCVRWPCFSFPFVQHATFSRPQESLVFRFDIRARHSPTHTASPAFEGPGHFSLALFFLPVDILLSQVYCLHSQSHSSSRGPLNYASRSFSFQFVDGCPDPSVK